MFFIYLWAPMFEWHIVSPTYCVWLLLRNHTLPDIISYLSSWLRQASLHYQVTNLQGKNPYNTSPRLLPPHSHILPDHTSEKHWPHPSKHRIHCGKYRVDSREHRPHPQGAQATPPGSTGTPPGNTGHTPREHRPHPWGIQATPLAIVMVKWW